MMIRLYLSSSSSIQNRHTASINRASAVMTEREKTIRNPSIVFTPVDKKIGPAPRARYGALMKINAPRPESSE